MLNMVQTPRKIIGFAPERAVQWVQGQSEGRRGNEAAVQSREHHVVESDLPSPNGCFYKILQDHKRLGVCKFLEEPSEEATFGSGMIWGKTDLVHMDK